MNERDDLFRNLSVASTVAIAGKQSDEAAPILRLGLAILLLPILSGPFWNSSSLLLCASLFLIVILFRVNDPVAEESSLKITLARIFEQGLTFESQGRNDRSFQGMPILIVQGNSNLCCLLLAVHRRSLWF